ncbi:MAG: hypothetical protein IGS50_07065 [Synechococcales cyanobacterium C42_A2020_086]|jgi:hypothetical protein|nr:hypothetical protein [Synechococcales cyanobacterium M58_A2018_015]MBF2073507.1 hypothetical protein [Synechococcales cyanobacterium C42_A2020_086]
MSRFPLDTFLDNPRVRLHDLDTLALLKALLHTARRFWTFSQFHGEYQSTPVWERYAKFSAVARWQEGRRPAKE